MLIGDSPVLADSDAVVVCTRPVLRLPSSAYGDDRCATRDVPERVTPRPTTTAIQRSSIDGMPIVGREHSESTSTDQED
jgi:hypothetical protein